MNVIRYNVNSTDACNIGYQYEHNASKVVFSGYVMKDPANEIYFKFMGRTAASRYLIPIVDMTLDITHLLTKNAGTFKCQLEERTAEGDFVGETPVFQVHVGTSIKSNADYEIVDDRLPTLYTKYNEMYNIIHRTNEQAVGNELERQANWETLRTEVRAAIADIDGSLDSYKAETTAELQGNVNEYKTATTAELQSDLESYERTTSELVWGRFQTYADSFAGLYERRFSDYQREADMNITNEVLAAKEGLQADIDGKFSSTKAVYDLEIGAVVSDLERRRDNGDFNGKDGYTPVKGKDYRDGIDGTDYVITEADYQAIGDKVEAEYTPELTNVKESLNQKADKTELALANRKINALTNILEGRELAFEKMDFESAVIDVPSGAVADSILKIGGKSVVSKNYLPLDGWESEKEGQVNINKQDATVTVKSRQSYSGARRTLDVSALRGKTIVLKCNTFTTDDAVLCNVRIRIVRPSDITYTKISPTRFISNSITVDSDVTDLIMEVRPNNTTNNLDFDNTVILTGLMIVDATNSTIPYEPYFEGIVSSQTDEVAVRGKMLLDESAIVDKKILNDSGVEVNDYSGFYYNQFIPTNNYKTVGLTINYTSASGTVRLYKFDANKSLISRMVVNRTSGYIGIDKRTITVESNVAFVSVQGTIGADKYQLVYGNAVDFLKSVNRSYPANLPEMKSAGTAHDEVDYNVTFNNMKSVDLGSLDWAVGDAVGKFYRTNFSDTARVTLCESYPYSKETWVKGCCGIANTGALWVYDDSYTTASEFKEAMQGVILHYEATEGGEDYTTNLLHERVGSVDLGTLIWSYNTTSNVAPYFSASLNLPAKDYGVNVVKALCGKYSAVSRNGSAFIDKTMCGDYGGGRAYIEIKDLDYTDATTFRNAMQGVILNYELATERIRELPNLPSLEAINVESGGEIRFVDHSEMALPIPSTHEFIVRNSEV